MREQPFPGLRTQFQDTLRRYEEIRLGPAAGYLDSYFREYDLATLAIEMTELARQAKTDGAYMDAEMKRHLNLPKAVADLIRETGFTIGLVKHGDLSESRIRDALTPE